MIAVSGWIAFARESSIFRIMELFISWTSIVRSATDEPLQRCGSGNALNNTKGISLTGEWWSSLWCDPARQNLLRDAIPEPPKSTFAYASMYKTFLFASPPFDLSA